MDLLTTRIDLGAIAHNTRLLARRVAPAALMAVVKADGYNHGAARVAQVMLAHGASQLGVATLPEAHALRAAGITAPILAWIWHPRVDDVAAALDASIEVALTSPEHCQAVLSALCDAPHRTARVTLKVDTGMRRNGLEGADFDAVCRALVGHPQVEVTGVMSHLACADEPDNPFTDAQARQFDQAIATARAHGLEVPVNHLCNSPATLTRPDLYHEMVRPGVALYGLEPVAGRDHGLRPAMSWVSTVTKVQPIARGEGTSYGLTWTAPSDGFLAVVPGGYADGLPRAFQNCVEVTIAGQRYPQVGRVCMDQFLVWLGANPHGVRAGQSATIFGSGAAMSATELAQRAGTINYEVVCRPCGRTVRTYVDQDLNEEGAHE
ncbi:alanine racemase [Corynebacterium uberis]|uniref:alanine racemase n=1 Tax=Corynebacterium TaxID=1716 RepID=UPI001D09D479|nr:MULTISPECIES: alanine racemase [Corynebacterium]MCZ9309352.1 alanine racemase [Corynebacterium sp. c6VSa_13]UDL72901.1 alanine racemase [Corynebacterium uberis]UDL76222.1 alanine racemase [Corynebacterium uberis]UDL78434.1 alanine racemase [Corynebacterium uberis]UDL80717.1 alanine racemase [Corynebacterium uberis]